MGQPHHYLRAHREVLTDDRDVLSVPGWPILSRLPQRVPGRVLDGGVVVDSLALARAAASLARCARSVLGPGVVVEPGAEVHDSVVFADTVVRGWRGGALVRRGRGLRGGGAMRRWESRVTTAFRRTGDVTLVGRGSRVVGAHPAGSRLEPGTTADSRDHRRVTVATSGT